MSGCHRLCVLISAASGGRDKSTLKAVLGMVVSFVWNASSNTPRAPSVGAHRGGTRVSATPATARLGAPIGGWGTVAKILLRFSQGVVPPSGVRLYKSLGPVRVWPSGQGVIHVT